MGLLEQDFQIIWKSHFGDHQVGHTHFWERALSRREFLGAMGVAGGAALGAPMLSPLLAEASSGFSPPNPIKGGTVLPFQGLTPFYFPAAVEAGTGDPSLIRDFNGFIGLGDFNEGAIDGSSHTWASDMRFMKGVYIGNDGREHRGAFAFI